MHESGEHVMTPLDNRHLIVQMQKAQPMLSVFYLELENAQALRCAELCVEKAWLHLFQSESGVRIKHGECHLDVISFKIAPNPMILLTQAQVILNFILDKVVLRCEVIVPVN